MAKKDEKQALLRYCMQQSGAFSLKELKETAGLQIAERTLRRWIKSWVDEGLIRPLGSYRSARYERIAPSAKEPKFLAGLSTAQRESISKQLRDLWTHNSTAIEGNTLSLGDTHFVLEQGLTISGKPIKDHQEVLGHARAIDLMYAMLGASVQKELIFQLHKAIQTEHVSDIYKPNGDWKIEPNGTYTVTAKNEQVYIEYARPQDVPKLMAQLIDTLNQHTHVEQSSAAGVYAKIHAGIAHIHPFWDGNGRIARLLANIPLLNSGLPPLIISRDNRRRYIQLLAEYQLNIGQINVFTGVWPNEESLQDFISFCEEEYLQTQKLIADALRQSR